MAAPAPLGSWPEHRRPKLPPLTRGGRKKPDSNDAARPPSAGAGPSSKGTDSAPPNRAGWPVIPGYEILGFLNGGGQGEIWRARQLKLDRIVAIKVLRTSADENTRARFQRESKLFARLHHPNIVEIHDCGEMDGLPFFVMEFVAGGSLKDLLARRAPLPPEAAAELVAVLAGALHHAHQAGIVHRDLKPANVLLGEGGVPKVTDFGLAKRLGDDGTWQTRSFAILGSACYMSPEQAAGKVKDIGPATDVWSLGAILYEALTGRPPFRGDTWLETLDLVRFQPALPPSQAVPMVPLRLESVVLKCLEKEPARRYPSAEALAEDLRRFLSNEPVQANTNSPASPAAVRLRRSLEPFRRPARTTASALAATPVPDGPKSDSPMVAGYELLSPLGTPPSNRSYRARQSRLGQVVALKFGPKLSSDPSGQLLRLHRLQDALGRLSEQFLARWHEVGLSEGRLYVARELSAGGTLADRPAGQPMPVAAAAALGALLAHGLSSAHRAGIVHGNIKPSNVLLATGRDAATVSSPGVTLSGSTPAPALVQQPLLTPFPFVPRLADFADAPGTGAPPTAEYLAPELAADPDRPPSPASDVWSMGVMLYEMLTGKSPFAPPRPSEVLRRAAGMTPASPFKARPQVPPPLSAVVMKCLSRDPADRYRDAGGLADDLQLFLDGRTPRAAVKVSLWQRLFGGWRS
jgi:serine/threonine protein kinase